MNELILAYIKKMKIRIYILNVLTLIGCNNSADSIKQNETVETVFQFENDTILKVDEPQKSDKETGQIKTINCIGSSTDFLKLENKELQLNLFANIDSIRKVQSPENDQESSIMVALTAEYLNNFLSDINSDSLAENQHFEKEYHFDIAPKDFTDPEYCKDKIAVTFDIEDCSFRLNIFNTFLVEPNWCTESIVVYGFKIKNNRIIDFWRQEAG